MQAHCIDSPIFIDHATGIVIGETTVIEKRENLSRGNLRDTSVNKDMKNDRHPTVEKNVCIYANAAILGGGNNSVGTVLLEEMHGLQSPFHQDHWLPIPQRQK
jgi:serine acetyltransferase